jgi:hypothetical protein
VAQQHITRRFKRFHHFSRFTGTTIHDVKQYGACSVIEIYFLSIKFLKIERNYNTRRNAARACGACLCHKKYTAYHSKNFNIDTFGDVKFTYSTFLRLTRFTVHDDTQRAPVTLACVTRNAQFTFQTFLRLTRFTVHDDTQRVPAALACVTKNAYFAFQLFSVTSETIHRPKFWKTRIFIRFWPKIDISSQFLTNKKWKFGFTIFYIFVYFCITQL